MRIAQLAPLVESIPPRGYGGTELIVSLLTEELFKRGHEVTLVAAGDSRTEADVIAVTSEGLRSRAEIPMRRWSAYAIRSLLELEKRQGHFDVVHNHMGYDALPHLRTLRCQTVTTNHNPIKDYCAPIYLACAHLPYVSISESYKRLNYPDQLNYVATIYNGINLGDFACWPPNGRTYLLFIGRICPDKGTLEAIQIAKRLGIDIVIAGKVDPADADYFEEVIRPHIDGKSVRFLGEVEQQAKSRLFGQAIAVVYPVAFEEPFGLVMAESLACGTPVMALDRGSVREVVSDGETAVIGESVDELVERFPEVSRLTGPDCRRRAERLFSKERMVDEYEGLYRSLCS